jgi:hypothetical protein
MTGPQDRTRDLIEQIVAELDELGEQDRFGMQGRRHTFGLED